MSSPSIPLFSSPSPSPSPVPIFAPDGTVRNISPDQAQAALNAGGVRAVRMKDPQGVPRWIRETDVDAATKAGGTLLQDHQLNPPDLFESSLPNNMTISAPPKSTGWLNNAENYLRDTANDLKYGTGVTLPGRIAQKMGAPGLYSGQPEAVGDFMGSPVLGTLRAAQGMTELPQSGKRWQGTKDVVGGTAQALTIPSAFMGGPATEAGAAGAANVSSKIFGDAEQAGKLFDSVSAAMRDKPIELSDEVYDALKNIKQLADAGAKGTPRVASKLANRLNNVDEELYWDEARRFYSNISRLSANEYQSMNPSMQRAVGQLGHALGDVMNEAAAGAGKGEEYAQAMRLYAKAKSWQQFGSATWQFIKRAAPYAAGVGTGGRFAISQALDKF